MKPVLPAKNSLMILLKPKKKKRNNPLGITKRTALTHQNPFLYGLHISQIQCNIKHVKPPSTITYSGRNMGYTEQVREFTKACNDDLPAKPQEMTTEGIAFIRQMVNDELDELEESKNVTEQADALVDAIYYICDFAVRNGINLDPLFDIVHGANMQKVVDGKVIRRDDGKILKPEGWEDPAPKLNTEMARQQNEGSFRA
ncbi:MAG: putative HAD superfamily Cof-like phosphohydrolase [Candidatus Latescibacterota bacterium]|jgi:predicted HAD superfamily Cof-like phosphohydrolase